MTAPRSILITGASSGIGAALAEAHAADGSLLALTGRDEARLAEVAARCRARGAEVRCERVDVTDRAAMAAVVARIDAERPLDLVIANAGIDGWGIAGDERYYGTFDVNVFGVFNTILPVIERMKRRRHGQIALMSSLAGFHGLPTSPIYCASKAAVRSLGEGLRGQLAAYGVGVSVITPGFVESGMTSGSKLPMPFVWTAERAAAVIRRRLRRNAARIAFPWPLYAAVRLMAILPEALVDRLLQRSPRGKY